MFRLILPVTICLAGPLSAQTGQACPPDEDQYTCHRVFACIGDQGRWFDGLARGRGPMSDIAGTLDDGVSCTGQRMLFSKMMTGSIQLACENGTSGTVDYTTPPHAKNFGTGTATTDDGRDFSVWVAHDTIAILRSEAGGTQSLLPCPGGSIRLD